jgi:hypothetical protein
MNELYGLISQKIETLLDFLHVRFAVSGVTPGHTIADNELHILMERRRNIGKSQELEQLFLLPLSKYMSELMYSVCV